MIAPDKPLNTIEANTIAVCVSVLPGTTRSAQQMNRNIADSPTHSLCPIVNNAATAQVEPAHKQTQLPDQQSPHSTRIDYTRPEGDRQREHQSRGVGKPFDFVTRPTVDALDHSTDRTAQRTH